MGMMQAMIKMMQTILTFDENNAILKYSNLL